MSRMHHPSSKFSPLSGFSRLEAILILLILATLAFLALPVYNTIQANRQDKATGVGGRPSAPNPQSEVDNNKTVQPPKSKVDQDNAAPPAPKVDTNRSAQPVPKELEDSQETDQSPD